MTAPPGAQRGERPGRPPGADRANLAGASCRFPPRVEVSDELLRRLGSVCTSVDTEPAACAAAGDDWWPISAHWAAAGLLAARPAAVLRPASATEVAAVLALCSEAKVPVTPAAGRSGVCGGAVPVSGGVALDLLGLSGVSAVDDTSLLVEVAPGTFGDDFERRLRRDHGLTAGHWPQSMAISTVGGWAACRGAGQYSTRYGKIEDMVEGLEVVLADGRVLRTGGSAPRAATGPDLTALFVGSEGTLGVITSLRLRVHPLAPAERAGAWVFPTFAAGLDACRRILRRQATPAVLRLYDPTESARHLGERDGCALLVLDEGDAEVVGATFRVVAEECAAAAPLGDAPVRQWLERRNEVPSLGELAAAGIVADTVEVAAHWGVLDGLYERVVSAVGALAGTLAVSAHQSHAYGAGACLYFTFAGRPSGAGGPDPTAAEAYYCAAWDAVLEATLEVGGAISHHHGVGHNRARYLRRALGEGYGLLEALKASLDPAGILNPGVLGLPSPFAPAPWP